jgi:D-sedoheptulose 7-phosphate isomerase
VTRAELAAGPTLAEVAAARIEDSVSAIERLLEPEPLDAIAAAGAALVDALRAGGKLLVFGNGGSAADADHIAAELLGRFQRERRALAAVALASNPATVTAIANDYAFDDVFARQLEALCRPGDVVLAISTSGSSANVIAGVEQARRCGATVIGLTGEHGGPLAARCDVCVQVPATRTARIQEGHTLVAHVLCEIVEDALAGDA